jgi:hypothetical protein
MKIDNFGQKKKPETMKRVPGLRFRMGGYFLPLRFFMLRIMLMERRLPGA